MLLRWYDSSHYYLDMNNQQQSSTKDFVGEERYGVWYGDWYGTIPYHTIQDDYNYCEVSTSKYSQIPITSHTFVKAYYLRWD